jgi:CelD/BcsL family acetyltransferase involved in cellulose biosynthesis
MYKTTIATLDEFSGLKSVWNELMFKMEYPVIFLTWEWIYTWWEHFGDRNRELLILVVSEGKEIRGILPLYTERMLLRNQWLIGRILKFCASVDLFPDHLDLIAEPVHARDCLASIFQFLSTEYRAWDVMRLRMVAPSSMVFDWMKSDALRRHRPGIDVEQASFARYIRVQGTFDDYLGRFDAKQRYNLRSRTKKLYEQYGFRYVLCEGDETEHLRHLFALHRRRAAQKRIESTFLDARIQAFHQALAPRIREQGWLSLRSLRREQEVIAASYNFEIAGRVFSYQKGFDPAWDRYGPGNVLMCELLREAFEKKRCEYNFLQGDEAYKSVWTQDFRTLSHVNIYNHSLLGRAACGSFHLKRRVMHSLRKRHVAKSENV